jgi:class 3 adenylate cyclase/pimeloyl-ACP methyl ester carboxylesterase
MRLLSEFGSPLIRASLDAGSIMGVMGLTPPPTQYAQSGDVHVAYQVTGSGEIDVVFAPGTVSHLGLDWERPEKVSFIERLSSFCRLIRFDKRGTGLSDRPLTVATLEERTDDIRAVMDAVGSERAVLLGVSEGASMALLFAATYPQRTRSLIVWGAMARWFQTDDHPWGMTREEYDELIADCRENWPSLWYLTGPGAGIPPDDHESIEFWVRYGQAAASPAAAAALEEMNQQIDVRDILPTIRVPTLVMNRRGDPVAHVDGARQLAQAIPGARFVDFPGDMHFLFGPESDRILELIEEFATGTPPPIRTSRMLSTIVSVDIVGSTERLAELGDAMWNELLGRFYAGVERELARHVGEEIDRAGDGCLAIFDGPTRAVRCATAIQAASRELGLHVRAGVHTGEVERADGAVRGIAVHLAARVAALAERDEVLVSSTVRDLVAGSGLDFTDAGLHELKGVPEPKQLFRLAA